MQENANMNGIFYLGSRAIPDIYVWLQILHDYYVIKPVLWAIDAAINKAM